ncbi:MAG: hypothetical protein J4F97_00195 [Pseudomonadales bacterium]|nr:hypothetical protein [Pseudomonadales bacterium]
MPLFASSDRPKSISLAVLLICANVVLLVLFWVLAPAEVKSNGGQVLGIVFWCWMAWACAFGHGWCRWFVLVALVAFAVGVYNSGMVHAWGDALDQLARHSDPVTTTTKAMGVVIAALLFLPTSRRWFRQHRVSRGVQPDEADSPRS